MQTTTFLALGLLLAALPAQQPLRVACAGDSITYGAGLPDRDHQSYPYLLGELFGARAVVANFGRNAATLMTAGDLPWRTRPEATALRGFAPDVVVLALGTNDSKAKNWVHKDDFAADYQQLVGELQALPSHPRVLLVLPPPAWNEVRRDGDIDGAVVEQQVVPAVRAVAGPANCEVIDLHTPFVPHQDWFPDGVHPDPRGSVLFARTVYAAVTAQFDDDFDLLRALSKGDVTTAPADFAGYRRLSFGLGDDITYNIVCPRRVAKGRPWLWNLPDIDVAALEHGFHVCWCDPPAAAPPAALQHLMVNLSLAKTPLMRSPGGQPSLDDALRFAGQHVVFAALPQPGIEWRGEAAGWGGGTWRDQHEALVELGRSHPDLQLVWLGDSITQGLTGARDRLSHAGGARPFDRVFGDVAAASFGISGDSTEQLLWRLDHGELAGLAPAVIVLTIGVNNLSAGDQGGDVALGIAAIVNDLRARQPDCHLLVLGCLPAGAADSSLRRERAALMHDVSGLDDGEHVLVRDLAAHFVLPDGSLHAERLAKDGIHLTEPGQQAWLDAVRPLVQPLLRH